MLISLPVYVLAVARLHYVRDWKAQELPHERSEVGGLLDICDLLLQEADVRWAVREPPRLVARLDDLDQALR